MGLLLGGPKCYAKRLAPGGIAVFLEWFDPKTDALGEGEPFMFLTRRDRFALSGNRGSAAIEMRQAHLYADSKTGAPTGYLIQFAAKAAVEIGLEPSRMNIRAIADAIVDTLPDLINMPPAPKPDAQPAGRPEGEAALIVDGQTIAETEIH